VEQKKVPIHRTRYSREIKIAVLQNDPTDLIEDTWVLGFVVGNVVQEQFLSPNCLVFPVMGLQ
jgi:hypothetical protein